MNFQVIGRDLNQSCGQTQSSCFNFEVDVFEYSDQLTGLKHQLAQILIKGSCKLLGRSRECALSQYEGYFELKNVPRLCVKCIIG